MTHRTRYNLKVALVASSFLLMAAGIGGGWGEVHGQTGGPQTGVGVYCKPTVTPAGDGPVQGPTPTTEPCPTPVNYPVCDQLGATPVQSGTTPTPCPVVAPGPGGPASDSLPPIDGAKTDADGATYTTGVVDSPDVEVPARSWTGRVTSRIGGWWSALVQSIW